MDTNVLISGLLNPNGIPGRILDMILDGSLEFFVDDRILAEYRTVLREKEFGIHHVEIQNILVFIERIGIMVSALPLGLKLPDASDLKFVEVARAGKTNFLVTGNLRYFPYIREAISPKKFMENLRNNVV